MPKVVDHAARREEIVDALLRVAERDGLDGVSLRAVAREGGWSTGVLYDNHDETGDTGQVLLINRGGAANPGQGWSAAHSTIWKYDGELVVQKPPTAQNYGITNAGRFRTRFYADGPAGVQELAAGELIPRSLYEAQLCERLAGVSPPPSAPPPASPEPPSSPPPSSPAPPMSALAFEAEELPLETSGAATSVETDDRASGGQWVALNAVGPGAWVKYTTPPLPAGRFRLELLWKGNTTRGIARVRLDGIDLGDPLDQYTLGQAYPSATLVPVSFGAAAPHVIQLEVTGKNPASSRHTLSADRFRFIRD